jgi:glycine cleavage system H protein
MNEPLPIDLFATKSIEYVLVLGFLTTLVLFWRLMRRVPAMVPTPVPVGPHASTPSGWFQLPLERSYHPGHGWARPGPDGRMTVGADDFAQKLVGRPDSITLPPPGARVEQGQPLSRLTIGDKSVDLLAPVGGEVVECNQAVLGDPELLNRDPYGEGWLVQVRPDRRDADAGGLLTGEAAEAWMGSMEASLRKRMTTSLGLLLQDGGIPVSGLARTLAGDDWDELSREFLLS